MNSKLRFATLAGTPGETLYEAFLDAFSDYAVPITLTYEEFIAMHTRRGVSYAASVGAFDGDRLVGFIFNGEGEWEGARCAYDAGTGIAPAFRGRGLSKALAEESASRLRSLGFARWLLEVLVENEKAIRTYAGSGFLRTRRLSCLSGTVADAARTADRLASKAGVRVRRLGRNDTARFAAWREWEPSWQNSDASVARSPERLVALGAYEVSLDGAVAGEPAAYAVATDGGSVFQLAVRPDARRRGIGGAVAAAIAAGTPDGSLRYVNVQSDDAGTIGLLASLGVAASRDQWEMVREL
ncbi:MAG: hypothetical protein CVV47_02130 [Spirochaetae bacterium HGW-Spirochaetae-3]|jgi:ribosomal protein S18 acetylase RimI-like enzyme|nr:MAG: hypothetical protein CVV47_02130 [Spirochaetae bacterium HGW-Spirochaetae-3]